MKVSCAIIISDRFSILGGRGPGKPDAKHQYDLAGKGCAEPGESHLDAAVRELREETGISLPKEAVAEVKDLGQWAYIPGKDLHIFTLLVDRLPAIDSLFCESTFESYGREMPELAAYREIPIAELDWMYFGLEALLKRVLNNDAFGAEVLLTEQLSRKKRAGLVG